MSMFHFLMFFFMVSTRISSGINPDRLWQWRRWTPTVRRRHLLADRSGREHRDEAEAKRWGLKTSVSILKKAIGIHFYTLIFKYITEDSLKISSFGANPWAYHNHPLHPGRSSSAPKKHHRPWVVAARCCQGWCLKSLVLRPGVAAKDGWRDEKIGDVNN